MKFVPFAIYYPFKITLYVKDCLIPEENKYHTMESYYFSISAVKSNIQTCGLP